MNEEFEVFADKLCEYSMKAYAVPYLERRGAVQSYRAKVISKNTSAQTMVVQRPYDNQITLPYADSAAYLSAGDECLVLVFGESSNAIVVSDGKLSSLGVNTMVRPNLLDNWYFAGGGSQQGGGQFPINQRGQTSYNAAGYGIDRWRNSNAATNSSIQILASGYKVTNTSASAAGYINQFMELDLSGMEVTASMLFSDGTLLFGTGVFPAEGETNVVLVLRENHLAGCMVEHHSNAKPMFTIISNPASNFTLKAVKLELGDTQTLAHQESGVWVLNEIPNYQEQLARCQRYLYVVNTYGARYGKFGLGFASNATMARFYLPLPVTMRTLPTLSTSGSFLIVRGGTGVATSDISIDSSGSSTDIISMTANVSSGLTAGEGCALQGNNDATARLIFSAEL